MNSIRLGKTQKKSTRRLYLNRTLMQVLILLACSLIGAQTMLVEKGYGTPDASVPRIALG